MYYYSSQVAVDVHRAADKSCLVRRRQDGLKSIIHLFVDDANHFKVILPDPY
jgi:hypothetical protein